MIVGRSVVRKFGRLVSKVEDKAISRMQEGRIRSETVVTDTYFAEMENVFDEFGRVDDSDVRFKAWWIPPKPEEKKFGADFCGVLSVRSPEFEHRKGFLCQAKMNGNGISKVSPFLGLFPVHVADDVHAKKLKSQAGKMLAVTPDSFVIVYARDGFVVVPAVSIDGLKNSGTIYGKPASAFFKEFLMCFVGDIRLKAADHVTLEKLRKETSSRAALMLEVIEEKR